MALTALSNWMKGQNGRRRNSQSANVGRAIARPGTSSPPLPLARAPSYRIQIRLRRWPFGQAPPFAILNLNSPTINNIMGYICTSSTSLASLFLLSTLVPGSFQRLFCAKWAAGVVTSFLFPQACNRLVPTNRLAYRAPSFPICSKASPTPAKA